MNNKFTINIPGEIKIWDIEFKNCIGELKTPCTDATLDFDQDIAFSFYSDYQIENEDLLELNILNDFGVFRELSLSCNENVSSEGMLLLKNPEDIERLSLFDCSGFTVFSFLKNFTGLRSIMLAGSNIDDEGLKALQNAKDLDHILLSWTDFPTKDGFSGFANDNEISIELDVCEYVDDEIVETIADSFPNLFELNLDLCRNITDKSVKKLSQHKKLEWLYISDCWNLTIKSLDYLANTTSIKWLSWGRTPSIFETREYEPLTSDEIRKLTEIQTLESLSLDGITNEKFSELRVLKGLKKLKWLSLGLVDKIPKDKINELQSIIPECKIVAD